MTYTVGATNVWVQATVNKNGTPITAGTPGQTVEMCIVPDGTPATGWQTVATWVDGYPAIKADMPAVGAFHIWARITTSDEGPIPIDCGTYTVTPD